MIPKDAGKFWRRYNILSSKDLPVLVQTGIQQSTLSTWKKKKIYPIADAACKIAAACNTTVEYLVTGQDVSKSICSAEAMEIAIMADRLNDEGRSILKSVTESLGLKYKIVKKNNLIGH